MKKDFEIKTERLILKPIGIKYLETVNEYATDPENTKYMMFLPNDSIDETREFLLSCDKAWEDENSTTYECAVILEETQIGCISLYINDGIGEFGWILNKRYWGKGYLTEAAKAMVEYAHEGLGLNHFIAHCDSENTASYRVMEKIGMKYVEKTGGRRNKLTPPGEERFELLYKMDL